MSETPEDKPARPVRKFRETPRTPSDADRKARRNAEKERAEAWIREKWVNDKHCPICSTQGWTITAAVEVRHYEQGAMILGAGSGVYPMFQVICNTCGYTRLFNAVISNVVEQEQEQAP